MRKRAIVRELREGLDCLRRMKNEEGVTVYEAPPVPYRDWTYDEDTADYIKRSVRMYLESWVIPKLERALEQVIISN